ncbi:MAG: tRNA lysidine(34) synthetase TilS [Anaerolineae bacterium]|nr:tRNA lysidine(34) synthetase TilS [Anaerolineae bacterium]
MTTASILDDVRRLQQRYDLFPRGKIVIAVSGGVDSLALLACLRELRAELGIDLHVATLDHGIRGAASAEDARFVADLCASWGIACTRGYVDVPALIRTGENLESVARHERYSFLQRVAREIGARVIATAHHLDDQAETILLHLLRGSGLAGLRGMQPKSPLGDGLTLIRPLLETPRTVIETYVASLDITPRDDETNADLNYSRNYLRHQIMPRLERINAGYREALSRFGSISADAQDFLQRSLPPLSADRSIERHVFLRLHPAQQQLLVSQAIALVKDIAYDTIQRTVADIRANRKDGELTHIRAGRIYFATAPAYPDSVPSLEAGTSLIVEEITLLPNGWRLQRSPATTIPAQDQLLAVLRLPSDATIQLRTPQRGDRFKPVGLHGKSQKLSDTLINLKVPQEWRSHIPLLIVNGEIAWIVAPRHGDFISRIADPFAPPTDAELESLICFRYVNQLIWF